MGLKWKKSPPTAKSVLAKRFTFLKETEAVVNGYHVVDQYYRGRFGELPIAKIHTKYFQGEFYKMHLTLAPVTRASKLFEVVLQKMISTYGEPVELTKPKKLYSGQAHLKYSQLDGKQQSLMEVYRKDSQSDLGRYALLDAQISSGMWYPKAQWVFDNNVEVNLNVRLINSQGDFETVWEFIYKDLEKNAKAPALFPARDY